MFFSRLEQLSFQQEEERKQKLGKWEIWIIRIEELEKRCQEKLENLRTKGQPEDRKDVEDQIILAQVSSRFSLLIHEFKSCGT